MQKMPAKIQQSIALWLKLRLIIEQEIIAHLAKKGFTVGGEAMHNGEKVRINAINISHDFDDITFDFTQENGIGNQNHVEQFKKA
jgi:hypothetical protein